MLEGHIEVRSFLSNDRIDTLGEGEKFEYTGYIRFAARRSYSLKEL